VIGGIAHVAVDSPVENRPVASRFYSSNRHVTTR
jgi:hypothetical protein